MNTKFFDLSKEKQDRIINGSLKIICRYGYRHASTDEIVAEAGISKGLLFHYFISKKGLFRFLYDYSAHYILNELRRTGIPDAEDYFEVQSRLLRTEAGIMQLYPCMFLFLHNADCTDDPEAREALEGLALLGAVRKRYAEILAGVPVTSAARGPLSEEDLSLLTALLTYARLGILRDLLRKEAFSAESFLEETSAQLRLLRKMNDQ